MSHGARINKIWVALAVCGYLSVSAAEKDVDEDLDLLPGFLMEDKEQVVETDSPISENEGESKSDQQANYLIWMDQTFTYTDWREESDIILRLYDEKNPDWTGLTRINGRGDYSINPNFEIKYDTSLNISQDGDGFQASENLRFDMEELYVSWKFSQNVFVDIGRVNIRNGVATGFNPTDYFRVNSVVTRTTEDVRRLRDNRLGSLASRVQKIWVGGALTIVLAPDVGNEADRWYTDKDKYGLHLNDTNDQSRYLLSWTNEIARGLSPELLLMSESGRKNIGLNVTYALTQKILASVELNRGRRLSIINEALYDGTYGATLHPLLESEFSRGSEEYFTLSALGLSYTSDQRITTNIEYHYNEAGLDEKDWEKYFNVAEASVGNPAIIGPLLSVKGVARSRLEPVSKHTAMIRSTWTDIVPDLSANILIYYDLVVSSKLTQVEVVWNYNRQLSATARLSSFEGSVRSNFGSMEQKMSAGIQLDYYF